MAGSYYLSESRSLCSFVQILLFPDNIFRIPYRMLSLCSCEFYLSNSCFEDVFLWGHFLNHLFIYYVIQSCNYCNNSAIKRFRKRQNSFGNHAVSQNKLTEAPAFRCTYSRKQGQHEVFPRPSQRHHWAIGRTPTGKSNWKYTTCYSRRAYLQGFILVKTRDL